MGKMEEGSQDSRTPKMDSLPPAKKGAELKNAIQSFQLPALQQSNLEVAIGHLGSGGPERHLLLFMPSRNPLIEAVAARAANAGITVDLIAGSVPRDESLQGIARKTNGGFSATPTISDLTPEWFMDFYSSLSHRYEVTYAEPDPGNPPDLRIRLVPSKLAVVPRN
jgi:hypothetical protein